MQGVLHGHAPIRKNADSCLQKFLSAHEQVGPGMSVSSTPPSVQSSQPLTRQEIRQLLASAKFSYVDLIRVARSFPGYVHGEANDLLHDALGAALGTRACPSGVTIEKALIEIMRSKWSTAARGRARRKVQVDYMPLEEIALAGNRYTVASTDEIQEIERVRMLCADVLERLSLEPGFEALIDAIDADLRGQKLADHLGLSRRELASLRRALKRKIQKLWPDVKQMLVDGEVV
ncbi:hypothetical protein [Sphingobium limneticum]|uniref:Uncharacterized protein n=1 Tax=Sphingobium limneticum TaxID=1007511 RepID=A0A5J5I489_9SPHN|nr:hypothetical protein [Sphingobium limneticum]KAA9016884.1 hypothetical protein F4U96_11705 [Sphingobium limneticum]KAA9029863.1 hypothetical protein F4U95_11650 [Sphingobium limneticum]